MPHEGERGASVTRTLSTGTGFGPSGGLPRHLFGEARVVRRSGAGWVVRATLRSGRVREARLASGRRGEPQAAPVHGGALAIFGSEGLTAGGRSQPRCPAPRSRSPARRRGLRIRRGAGGHVARSRRAGRRPAMDLRIRRDAGGHVARSRTAGRRQGDAVFGSVAAPEATSPAPAEQVAGKRWILGSAATPETTSPAAAEQLARSREAGHRQSGAVFGPAATPAATSPAPVRRRLCDGGRPAVSATRAVRCLRASDPTKRASVWSLFGTTRRGRSRRTTTMGREGEDLRVFGRTTSATAPEPGSSDSDEVARARRRCHQAELLGALSGRGGAVVGELPASGREVTGGSSRAAMRRWGTFGCTSEARRRRVATLLGAEPPGRGERLASDDSLESSPAAAGPPASARGAGLLERGDRRASRCGHTLQWR